MNTVSVRSVERYDSALLDAAAPAEKKVIAFPVRRVAAMAAAFVLIVAAALLLPGLIGYPGLFWAEILAWIGADFVLLPSYFHTLRKAEQQAAALRTE